MRMYDAHDIDVVMSMYNLIEYNDNYPKIYWILWQYWKDKTYINPANRKIADFTEEEHV